MWEIVGVLFNIAMLLGLAAVIIFICMIISIMLKAFFRYSNKDLEEDKKDESV